MQIALILMYYFMHRSHILFSLHVGHNAIILICINASGDQQEGTDRAADQIDQP